MIQRPGKESGDKWILTGFYNGEENVTGDWTYFYEYEGIEWLHVIPYLFDKLDGSSEPRITSPIFKLRDRGTPDHAWIPHDHGYYCMRFYGFMPTGSLYNREKGGEWREVAKVSRPQLDRVFYNELKNPVHGLSSYKPWTAYQGVRLGGGPDWPI